VARAVQGSGQTCCQCQPQNGARPGIADPHPQEISSASLLIFDVVERSRLELDFAALFPKQWPEH